MKSYKTREFARLARNEAVDDGSLRDAVERAERGLIDAQLGRFLIKQRIARRNEGRSAGYRAIVFHMHRSRAVFLHLFAKNEKGNLTPAELAAYREFAKSLADIEGNQVAELVRLKKWIEIP